LDPEVLRGFFRIGVFVGVCGLVMAFFQPRGSSEFVLSVCSALIGGVLIVGVSILTRWFVRHEQLPAQEGNGRLDED